MCKVIIFNHELNYSHSNENHIRNPLSDLELELTDLLQEFADVVDELREPSQSVPYAYERLLSDAKRRTGLGDDGSVVSDSGVEDNSDCSE